MGEPKKTQQTFIDRKVLNEDGAAEISSPVDCGPYRKFQLLVRIVETGDPADSTVQVVVKFADEKDRVYHDYQNGPFGFMLWEEDAIPAGDEGLLVATSGDCVGKTMKVYVVAKKGVTLDATNYFTVTIKAHFMD